MSHKPTMPHPKTKPTDLPLGGYVFHGTSTVKIFGRERDQDTGEVVDYWVVSNEGRKNERRYPVSAKMLRK